MKNLKNPVRALFSFTCLALISQIAIAQTPVITTYLPDDPHEGYYAPQIALCTTENPCSNITLIEFDVYYDALFDDEDYEVDGMWFSPDGETSVDIVDYPAQQRVHVTLSRTEGRSGSGIFMKIPGLGIIDEIDPKRNITSPAVDFEANAVHVYPNPCNQVCQFSIGQQAGHAELRDIQGKVVWKAGDLMEGQHTIPVNELQPGVYLLQVLTGGKVHTHKIMVAHS